MAVLVALGQPRLSHSDNKSGGLFAAIPLGPLQALILSLRIADGLGQHLTQLGLGLRGFPLGWLPCGHRQYVGMPEGKLKPAGYRSRPAMERILLQKSKVVSVRISGQIVKREEIADSYRRLSGLDCCVLPSASVQ